MSQTRSRTPVGQAKACTSSMRPKLEPSLHGCPSGSRTPAGQSGAGGHLHGAQSCGERLGCPNLGCPNWILDTCRLSFELPGKEGSNFQGQSAVNFYDRAGCGCLVCASSGLVAPMHDLDTSFANAVRSAQSLQRLLATLDCTPGIANICPPNC